MTKQPSPAQEARFLGIDVGAETIKVVEMLVSGSGLKFGHRRLVEHHKEPGPRLLELLGELDWATVRGAAVSGRLGRLVRLPRIPTKQAQARGYRHLFGERPATVVSIGSHGFSVLELRGDGLEVLRENSRCSQGTGNFLRQLVERFDLTPAEASELCAGVEKPAPLSGRCPVILKTDMTHLANKGESREAILAGLFDAVCENVMVLVKPGVSPPDVALIGGVSRSRRIRRTFFKLLDERGMTPLAVAADDAEFFEAIGDALAAAEQAEEVPALNELLAPDPECRLESVAGLAGSLGMVRRMPARPAAVNGNPGRDLIFGFDIGSTGSKAVAFDAATCETTWEGYRRTSGDPVGAAQELLGRFVAEVGGTGVIRAFGVTGSGREITGSLLATCYGGDGVFVLNEIAAHAEGALHYDPRVDTIFEIGGQDAKYIRLADGRVIDCAMNEACSAGTGSFIEEQGGKFAGIRDVVQLSDEALRADRCVSLGQHCSVFMAEVIGEAVGAGRDQREIIAGLYDSIIQNYLHRVKGNRSVGSVIFCQGMPFSSDALAAAVARQTGSEIIIPPNPGTVGALGIALLTRRELRWKDHAAPDPQRFLDACIESKETFVCGSTSGCGGSGNHCRIDSIRTLVADRRQRFNWGGACSLYDKGGHKRKLPDRSPDPFREREELVRSLVGSLGEAPGARTVALTDEFMLKGMLPLFATLFRELGLNIRLAGTGDHAALKRGITGANIPFCAPMQLYHGVVSRMAEESADLIFLPMIRGLGRVHDEKHAKLCPVVQASPWLLRSDLASKLNGNALTPVIDVGTGNYNSPEFRSSCAQLAAMVGVTDENLWSQALERAVAAQRGFDDARLEIGRQALSFCAGREVPVVVVVGRPYTIYNKVLNSNVPAILREQGAMALPLDCLPIDDDVPVHSSMYWAHGQQILRAAHQVRRMPGVHAIYCSNYSCGPDSFNLHFFAYQMAGKPFAIIETDGHAGDAGTKTRVEAFLHCVAGELRAAGRAGAAPSEFGSLERRWIAFPEIKTDERILLPSLGPFGDVLAACLRGRGYRAEALPPVDAPALRAGRRVTSGKECIPAVMTLGALLHRLDQLDPAERVVFGMPGGCGPCRQGIYNLFNQMTLEQQGLDGRVRIWAPHEEAYFATLPPSFSLLILIGFMVSEALTETLLDVRPVEIRAGAADALHQYAMSRIRRRLETCAAGQTGLGSALWQAFGGGLFGMRRILEETALAMAALRNPKLIPTVLVVGEIYVRSNPCANDDLIRRLERRGMRARVVPCVEFIDYIYHLNRGLTDHYGWGDRINHALLERVHGHLARSLKRCLGHCHRPPVTDTIAAASGYLPVELEGEAVLTIGAAVEHWRAGKIDAVVNVGPLECMPTKVAESQFFHVARDENLPNLTISLNGDSLNTEMLDNFAYEVHERFRHKTGAAEENEPGPDSPGCPAGLS